MDRYWPDDLKLSQNVFVPNIRDVLNYFREVLNYWAEERIEKIVFPLFQLAADSRSSNMPCK